MISILIILTFLSCNQIKAQEKKAPQQSKNPTIIEKAKPVSLTQKNIDQFITWVVIPPH